MTTKFKFFYVFLSVVMIFSVMFIQPPSMGTVSTVSTVDELNSENFVIGQALTAENNYYDPKVFKDDLEIQSVGYGGVLGTTTISELIIGTPLNGLLESIITKNPLVKKSIIDQDGYVVEDPSCLVVDDETAEHYRVCLQHDGIFEIYTLSHRGIIKIADFNNMDTETKYFRTGATGKHLPGILQSIWTGMGTTWSEGVPYGIAEEITPGNKAVKLYPGGMLEDNTTFLNARHAVTIPDPEGIYLTSVKIKGAEHISIEQRARLGNQNSLNYIGTGQYAYPTVLFDATDHTVKVVGITIGTYIPGQWYDVEFSYDYTHGFLSIWIDGISYIQNLQVGHSGTKHDTYGKQYTPYISFTTVGDNVTENVWFDDYQVMQVATMDYHQVRRTKGMTVYHDSKEATALTGGGTYILENTLDLFAGTVCNNFIVMYREEYEDSEENPIKDIKLLEVEMKRGLPVSITLPDIIVEYHPNGERVKSKIVVKAMSMSENLQPNGNVIVLR